VWDYTTENYSYFPQPSYRKPPVRSRPPRSLVVYISVKLPLSLCMTCMTAHEAGRVMCCYLVFVSCSALKHLRRMGYVCPFICHSFPASCYSLSFILQAPCRW
jgi:hypothetical protein